MGDPFVLATGIAGLISLALEVTQITCQYVNGVRNAAKEINHLLAELSALVNVLRRLYCFLQDSRINKSNFNHTSVLFLTHRACDEQLQALRSSLLKRSNGHRMIKSLTWPFVKREHQETVLAIHRWVQIFQFALTINGCRLLSRAAADVTSVLTLQLETLEETKKISQAIPSLQQSTQEALIWMKGILESVNAIPAAQEDIFHIKENVETLQRLALDDQVQKSQKLNNQKRQKLLDWLSPLNVGPKQSDILSRRSPSTGEWLTKENKFRAWFGGSNPSCLWCSGIPGAGKTVLTSIVIDQIQSNPPTSRTVVAYMYFDYKNKDAQNVLAVFSSLLRQILEATNTIPKELESHYSSRPSHRRENSMSIDECLSFLQIACESFDRIFLVFDALDECIIRDDSNNEPRSKIITMIKRASRFATIFITSRPHVNLTQEIDCACLEIRATDSDMRSYLKARINNHKILRRIIDQSPSLESRSIDTICSKANGMFLLARLQMDSLANQTSARNMCRALEHLPDKLKDTFSDAMKRTAAQPKEYSQLAAQIISWIYYAKRPLTVAELREALSVEYGDIKLDRSGRHDVDLLTDVCCGLVSVGEQDKVIRLVHYSFQQYLDENWTIDFPHSQRWIAITCLTYLMLDDFSPEAMDEVDEPHTQHEDRAFATVTRSQWQDSHRFFTYVVTYWGDHVRGSLEKELEPLILRFLDRKMHLMYSLQLYNRLMFRNLGYDTWPHKPSSLHLTAYWGLPQVTRALIRRGADVHATDVQKRSPLFCAALNGHGDVAYALLDEGAVINVKDVVDATPSHAAVINDHIDISRLFLLRGADPNALDKDGSSPMSLAASNGNLSMMDLLFQKGAIAGKTDRRGVAPLEIASRGGHLAAIQWLLMRGIEIDSTDVFPLIEATYANHPQIVRILLDAGAPIDAIDGLGHTALCVAIKQKNSNLIERLVLRGADVDMHGTGFENECPLQMAIRAGDAPSVKLLINNGARVDVSGEEIGTVLQLAVFYRNSDIVRMILSKSHSSDIILDKGIFGASPLHLAVQLKDIVILSLLLNHRSLCHRSKWENSTTSDLDTANKFRITPLHQAVYLSWKSGIKALIDKGADPKQLDLYGQTCLDWALPDKDLFHEFNGPRRYHATDQATQRHSLHQSVRDLVSELSLDPRRRGGRRIDYHYLGHCLLRLSDLEEASTAFEQLIMNVPAQDELPVHNIVCHQCGGDDVKGSRFVCYTCADIDLCAVHMETYGSNPPDRRCKGHQFLKVPRANWKRSESEEADWKGERIDEWLARLLRKYG